MDKNYGAVFKILRLQKGFSIKELTDSNISQSTLSRFENGQVNLSIDKFFHLLSKMNLSPQEYFTRLEETTGTSYSISMLNIITALDNRNYLEIETFLKNLERQGHGAPISRSLQLQITSIKALLHQIDSNYKIDEREIFNLKQYLLSTKTWGEFEIQLCGRAFYLFDTADLRLFLQRLLDPFNYSVVTFNIRLYTYIALVNLTDTLLYKQEYDLLDRVEKYLSVNPFPEHYIFQKGTLQFKLALFHFYTKDKGEALLEMHEIVTAFKVLGAEAFASRLREQIPEFDTENFNQE
ncbi:helix-turn-helix domain-containing protein [Lactococcus allomyrinae]|uniref:Rgg/GadR/MutR family transcriptional regulator n=1 Tax=Lactococcus allomyrinae TaxID=2419773 RepID=A0A387BC36_9LACT|nr:Rgg/GadR/MutR family transcriptional regulator [Lactococcus allomyrinae]AYF99903.1 Rgg/GadR/MutR family transcriptional regulator [Lactococcus allomyrinae]